MIQDRPGRPNRYQVSARVVDAMIADNALSMPAAAFEEWLSKNVPAQTRILLLEMFHRNLLKKDDPNAF
ncbi:hypothetical protein [uncultured Tateyamaria sp.]|uniref:hypothetical protein n=1 Tax=uncultured Tateyamaria sp. TaxID=455651 RepID=UPI00262F07D4|nr:hypothetical protein [uncultured Tateyamaria sp.]